MKVSLLQMKDLGVSVKREGVTADFEIAVNIITLSFYLDYTSL